MGEYEGENGAEMETETKLREYHTNQQNRS